ncbi:hypothetical protein SAY86_017017 [Trapa natans]|uniref:Diacylglycerol O-acyltransferase n=1 Tax=Trapa natans TaxID=22666 RepID=A0AAN7M0M0_TRANT|nr:hypothetical protein SAY86_017017 [Trapa natans]
MTDSIETEKAGGGDMEDQNEGDAPRWPPAIDGVVGVSGFRTERLSPAARLFHSPKFNCCIVAIMGCKTSIDPDVVKAGLRETLLNHPRFSSKMVGDVGRSGRMKWVPTHVNLDDHVIVPRVDRDMDSSDQFVEDYISCITKNPLDSSRPLWELHLLNVRTSDAEAVGVLRIHHSMGDGASLMSLLLACTRKTSDPDSLPTVPLQNRAGSGRPAAGFWWFFWAIWAAVKLFWNTVVDLSLFIATFLFLKDTETPIKGKSGVAKTMKRFVHRTVSLDDIKLVKNKLNMSINDVILGITQGGLSRYLARRYAADGKGENGKGGKNIETLKNIRLRATILVNLRPAVGIQALSDMMAKKSRTRWGNWIGYIVLPFSIRHQEDPLEYVRLAKATIDRKKHSLEAALTFVCAEIVLKVFGANAAAFIAERFLFQTTLAFSNVVGPVEEISFYGHPIAYLAPSVFGHPHALTIHYQSYANKMTISLAVDPEVIGDPYQLCDDLEECLSGIKASVLGENEAPVSAVP